MPFGDESVAGALKTIFIGHKNISCISGNSLKIYKAKMIQDFVLTGNHVKY